MENTADKRVEDREKLALFMVNHGIATGHGDTQFVTHQKDNHYPFIERTTRYRYFREQVSDVEHCKGHR